MTFLNTRDGASYLINEIVEWDSLRSGCYLNGKEVNVIKPIGYAEALTIVLLFTTITHR